jgi:uncharacterized protein
MTKKIKTLSNDGMGWGYDTAINFSGNPITGVFDMGGGPGGHTAALSGIEELAYNSSYYFVSMNRVLITYAYVMHGVLRTLVDQPVYDAFRGGLTFKSDELDEDDIQQLDEYMKYSKTLKVVRDALRWDRLFGGAGVIINTNQNYSTNFKKESIGPNSKLSFIPADRWEIVLQGLPQGADMGMPGYLSTFPAFDYYGRKVDPTRVIRVVGEEAPALARRRLQGWGMSVIECVLRELNTYLKHQNATFDLIDQVKIDVYKLKDFNSKVLSKWAQGKVVKRITMANQIKNFANAIMLDSEDEYEQKQLSLAGLADTIEQIRVGIAAAVRMPLTKLFGLSATGFNSGEDDRENYNTIVEHERERAKEVLDRIMPLICRHLFGFEPQLSFDFKPLRILNAVDEENVKNAKFNRHTTLWNLGFYTDEEFARSLKEDRIVLMDTEVSKGTRLIEPPLTPAATFDTPQQVPATKKVTEDTAK